jgi:hypothetical protein
LPNAGFVAVSAGYGHSLALKSNGSVVGWGANEYGQCDAPPGHFIAIAAGDGQSVGLKSDGTLAFWGSGWFGQPLPDPNENFIALATGHDVHLAIKRDDQPTPIQIGVAVAEVRNHDVRLRWSTPLDVRDVRFNVYRSEGGGTADPPLGELLTNAPLVSQDGTYEFVDATIRSNHDYEYRLEMLADGTAPEVVRTLQVHVGHLRWSFGITAVRPHPVSGPWTIALEIPEKGQVSLELMDVGGRRVRQLVDTDMDEGVHEVALDSRHGGAGERPLAAGVYYAVLRCKGRVEGKRIIVTP